MSIAPNRTKRDTYSGRVDEDPPSSSSLDEVSIASTPVAVSVAISRACSRTRDGLRLCNLDVRNSRLLWLSSRLHAMRSSPELMSSHSYGSSPCVTAIGEVRPSAMRLTSDLDRPRGPRPRAAKQPSRSRKVQTRPAAPPVTHVSYFSRPPFGPGPNTCRAASVV